MDNTLLISILSLASGAIGVLIAWLVFSNQKKKDNAEASESKGSLASDIGYIKAGVDDLKRESRDTKEHVTNLEIKVACCEESCKQAHKRIDELHKHIEER